MTMFKKLLAVTLIFVGAIGLVGCKPEDEGLTDLEKLAEALVEVNLASEASSDLTLPTTGLHDVVIAWTSSDTDVIADDGTITIPTFTDGDKVVTITASLTLGDDTLTKTFDVTVLAATVKTDVEKIAEAKTALLLAHPDQLVVDLTLMATGLHESTVTWATSDATVITAAGVIARPTFGDGNATATLTATITIGTLTETKEFFLTVKENDPENMFLTIAAIHAASTINDIVEFEGIVTAIFDGGYVLTDGTHAMTITNYSSATKPDVEIGDLVYVKGEYAVYHSMYQIFGPTIQTIKSSDNAIPITPTVKTIAEVLALDSDLNSIHALHYTVTGFITEGLDAYDDEAVFISMGDDSLLLYSYSLADSIAALETFIGQKVTLTIVYYVDHSTKGVTVIFDGLAADITVETLTEAEKLEADLEAVDGLVANASLETVVLPTAGTNGTTYTDWVSDNTDVFANDGTFVARALTTVTVTFTATADNGDETGTATIEVIVPILSTIEEVLAMELGSYFEVTGVVYEESSYGFFIHENGHYLFIYEDEFMDDIKPGDTVTVLGKSGAYSGLLQVSVLDYTIDVTDLALVTPVVLSVGALENDLVQRGTIATVTGTLKSIEDDDGYFNTWIVGPAGAAVEIYWASNADELENNFDDIITIDVVTYQNAKVLYQGLETDITVETAFTDLQTAQEIADLIDLGDMDMVEYDLTLDVANVDPVATIAWASTNTAVVDVDGTVVRVMGSDTVVTLTATVTVNSVDATRDFVLNVIDGEEGVPFSVSEALALENTTDDILVTGVVIGTYLTYGDNEKVIQDPVTGVGIYVDFDVEAEIGDLIVVSGELETYTSNDNNRRQIDSGSLVKIISSDHAIIVDAETDPAVIAEELAEMRVYTATLTFDNDPDLLVTDPVNSFNSYGYAFFTGSVTKLITMSTYDFPYMEDLFSYGDTVEATFTVMDLNYGSTRVVNVTLHGLTEAQKMIAAEVVIDVPDVTIDDITLDTELTDLDATITWVSTNPAITNAGVVTRPAIGEADATGNLTATVTIGSLSEDFVFPVIVSAEAAPISVAAAQLLTAGDNVFVQGVITSILGDGTFTIEDADGTAIVIDDHDEVIDLSADLTIAIGDLVYVTGKTSNYNSLFFVDTVTEVIVESSGNAITDAIAITDLAAFRSGATPADFGKRYTFTSVTISDSGYYAYFYDDAGASRMGVAYGAGTSEDTIIGTTFTTGDVSTFTATLYGSSGTYTDTTKIFRFAITVASEFTLVTPAS